MKMITRGALAVLILIACAAQLQASADSENAEGEGYMQDTEESEEAWLMHDYLYLYEEARKKEAKSESLSQDQMPPEHIRRLQITTYLHTALYCIVLVYGLLHLPIWQRMYHKFNKSPEAAEPEGDGPTDEEPSKLRKKSVQVKDMS